jgi:hypothetical protein
MVDNERAQEMNSDRPDTGPMRFADDWAGIFLRGDYACPMAFALDAALSAMADGKAPSPITIAQLRGLGRVLSSCNEGDGEPANVQQMRSFAACVETAE